jgi:hypothetical protein
VSSSPVIASLVRPLSEPLATLRLFIQHVEFEDEHEDGDSFLVHLASSVLITGLLSPGQRGQISMSEVFRWVFEELRSESKGESLRKVIASAVGTAVNCCNISNLADTLAILDIKLDDINPDDIDLDDMELGGRNRDNTTINAAAEPGGFSILHYVIRTTGNSLESYDLLNFWVGLGADVHRLGYNTRYQTLFPKSCGVQSPTTIAMRCSNSFYVWRAMLVENEHCLNCFVVRELQNSLLASQGWTRDTLLALFRYDFRPRICHCDVFAEGHKTYCRNCRKDIKSPQILGWERMLEMIKLGEISDVQELDHSRGTDETPPRNCTKKSCLNCGHAMSAKGLTELIESERVRKFNDQECESPVFPASDENSLFETDHTCDKADWDSCKAQEEVLLESPATSIDEEEEEEDFQPQMPGGFDLNPNYRRAN